ncbi:LacI family DNA-binding transcriptional regulator [Cellulomonas alba]|uniref:LacI family DNA-binding transcriptional regulator n=1 Tax=Cellulomonas alba TaxID=3053467 RepID=A0ABT7SEU9_9CELL|nr:LacI family DNA-binding transcriptional regulator [Cellulomonas alba]MDM7854723.1 LacI family DNA-binding transcriptional regulator [Cellulomonas alba]
MSQDVAVATAGDAYPDLHGASDRAGQGDVVARVTLQTVADKVGVSRMTVSNAFSRPDQLSAELRRKILAAADELGYVGPDPAARALARGSAGTIGVVFTESVGEAFRDPIAASFLGAVATELGGTGRGMTLLPSTGAGGTIPARDIAMDGALLYACTADSQALDWLQRRRLPLVFVDQAPVEGASSVLLDDRAGSAEAARHLLELGHRRVGLLVTAWGSLRPGDSARIAPDAATAGDGYVSRERVDGWMSELGPAGAEVLAAEMYDNTERYAEPAARLLLDRPDRPTAILCFSDLVAWTVLRVARELGLDVPGDVSVVGYDDSPIARSTAPELTTVRQDLDAKGRATATLLDHEIARSRGLPGAPDGPEHVTIPTRLVVRGSTAPPRG